MTVAPIDAVRLSGSLRPFKTWTNNHPIIMPPIVNNIILKTEYVVKKYYGTIEWVGLKANPRSNTAMES